MNTTEKKINYPTRKGQIVKFHTPYPDENPDQLYVLLEIFDYEGDSKNKATIKALNTGLSFPPINKVLLEDLEIAEVDTSDLMGYPVTIIKEDKSKVNGRVVEIEKSKLVADLSLIENRVETNVKVTIRDGSGQIHQGLLAVIF